MEKINVDLIPNENDLKVIHASQNDTESRKFGFKLFSQEGFYDVPEITNIDLKYDTETGGTETLLPVNTSTPTTTPLNAIINGDEVYFNERVSDGNKQNIEKIKGNTLVWNQLVQNGNFADTSVWTVATPVTFTVQNNIATLTTNTDGDYNIRQLIPMIIGHKYIYFVDCWTDDNTYTEAIIFYGGASDVAICEVPTNNTWASFSGIFTCVSNQYNFIRLRNQKIGITNKFRNVNIIDLTLMFGAGNEPTSVSDFTNLFSLPYYDYNAGSLLSFNGTGIKSVGFNQWDEEWETGGINASTGENAGDNTRIRSKNYINCLPDTDYYVYNKLGNIQLFYYDSDKNYLSYTADKTNSIAKTPVNCRYMKFRVIGTTNDHDICINISNAELNGTYEPYKESTISLPISTYFPNGMKSARNVYDELTPSKAITKIGTVDLGTLTWNYVGAGTSSARFVGDILPDASITSGGSSIANAICSKYEIVTEGQVFINQRVGLCITSTGRPMVYDPAFTDAATFKQAMDGVYLYYELATPTEEDFMTGYLICSNGAEIPLYEEDDLLVCECDESLTGESGTFDCKIRLSSEDEQISSNKFRLKVEERP